MTQATFLPLALRSAPHSMKHFIKFCYTLCNHRRSIGRHCNQPSIAQTARKRIIPTALIRWKNRKNKGDKEMLKRLIGLTREKPLHLRFEPSFMELQQQLDAAQQHGTSPEYPSPRIPTLTLEEATRLKQASDESSHERPRLTLSLIHISEPTRPY